MHDDRGAVPGDLDVVVPAGQGGDDAVQHLARLVLLEGELRDLVQRTAYPDQVKHVGPSQKQLHMTCGANYDTPNFQRKAAA